MEFIVWVETRLAGKTLGVEEVAKFERCADGIPPEDIGLTLAEGKDLVGQVQRKIVQTQIEILSLAKSRFLLISCDGRGAQFGCRTRARSRSSFARPYI